MRLGRQSPGFESDRTCFFFQVLKSPFQKKIVGFSLSACVLSA